ncbi:acyltransferase [Bacteroides fragilis]|uniref:acyltransferase n=1 Tax=Bacteroides fragilis TaxID=817 RepID=UPI001F4099C5|nr:acyltransferase [Bacteroides fragilis]MCE8617789.1 acyltransferase [Bacteroides fragilis]MCZ2603508.1 acyltransferase [Bacteroides fragilis]UHZ86243.1 acyltransferase [Bacteroides fragilis]
MNIVDLFYKFLNKFRFRKVQCSRIVIGPEYNKNFVIINPHLLEIGEGTVINGNCFINALGKVRIGSYCHIGKGLTIYSHNHNYLSHKYIPYDDKVILRPVTIGNAVWIGANVTIAPGSVVGEGAVIGIGAVVSGVIPPYAIVGGNPASVIKYRDRDVFEKLKKEKKYY